MAEKSSVPEKCPTIGDIVLQHLRELDDPLGFLRADESWPDIIRRDIEQLGVLDNLSESQKHEIAALVAELYWAGDAVEWVKELERDRKTWVKHGLGRKFGRIGKLKRKVEKARRALQDLRDYLREIGIVTGRTPDGLFEKAANALSPDALDDAAELISSLADTAPKKDAVSLIYEFFEQCLAEKAEAEVRTAKIGNRFWDWKLPVNERYNGGENWKGCPAIRKYIARARKPSTDTPEKSR
jgi:hypothetical protein